jgi:DNA polymerase elongation subunit (family B)
MVLYRGVENGKRIRQKINYNPTLYIKSQNPTNFGTILGEYVSEIKPGNIRDCRDFIKRYEGVENFKIYGNRRYEYTFISDEYPNEVLWDRKCLSICNLDIEVASANGFPDPATATEEITAITYKMNDKFVTFGCGDFTNTRSDMRYIKCFDEIDLIKRFIDEWSGNYPDIITGWHISGFDIPYLVNRIRNLLGEDFLKRLSPWGYLVERRRYVMGKEKTIYLPSGIAVLDYIELYRKFAEKGQSKESYKLDYICHVELNERKLSYEEYDSLHTLYKEDFQKFIEYNIRDVELVEKLDNKLKLLDLALTLAYDSKTNYEDVFQQVRMWDCLIYNHLKKNNIVVPPIESHTKDESYIGAYVKDPIVGLHKWIASFDLASLYPMLIIQNNISPDTFIEPEKYTDGIRKFVSTNRTDIESLLAKKIDTTPLKDNNVVLTPNGQFFKREYKGFLPEMMEEMYKVRAIYKKKAIEAKKDLEKETEETKKEEIESRIARYNNLQLAKKVCLNSAYGAFGSPYFRFFDIRQATAITTAGQLSIRWVALKLNLYLNKLLKTGDKDYVIGSDTDSVFLSFDELVSRTFVQQDISGETKKVISFLDKVCETKIQPVINDAYNDLAGYTNALEQRMIMKREILADKGIWTAKKRYILNVYNNEGVAYTTPTVKIVGLEMIKSSTPNACREKLKEAIDIILNKNEECIIEFIQNFREEFAKLPSSDIAFPRGMNGLNFYKDKKTDAYKKGTPIHVRGSIIYNQQITKKSLTKKYQIIKEGEKIKFLYLKEPNPTGGNIIAFPQGLPKELDLEKYIDYNTQYEKSFVEPLKMILSAIGWKDKKVNSLESFFV